MPTRHQRSRPRRTLAGDVGVRMSISIIIAAFVLGACYYIYSSRAVAERLTAEARHTADEMAQMLVLPLYNIDDEAVRQTARIYLGSGRVSGLRVTSSISGTLFDNLAGTTSIFVPISRTISKDGLELGKLTMLFDDSAYRAARHRVIRTTIAATLAGLLVIGVVLRLVLRSVLTEPLDTIISRLNEIAAGDYTGHLAPVPQVELNAIVTAANRMSDEIADRNRRLEESEQMHREIFNATSDAIFIHDAANGRIIDVNQTMLDMFGYGREDIASLRVDDISLSTPPYTDDEALNRIHKAAAGEPQLFEWHARRKNGDPFWVEVALEATTLQGRKVVLAVVRDISERKELEAELRQAQKIEAMGVLAGGIAHDFNNILSAIFGYTELALMEADPASPLAADLRQIETASERARDLVHQILTFSRRQEQEKKPLRLALVVKEALQLLRSSIPSTIAMERAINSEAMVLADPGQMHQLVVNLCTNAFHAMESKGGVLRVELTQTELAPGDLPGAAIKEAGPYLVLTVSDTGYGISPAIRDKIFEPYFTTKVKGKGTGLGLAVVHGIVTSHQGHITVQSEVGQGTVFTVYLPILKDIEGAGVREEQDGVKATAPPVETARIMVVDDEEHIRSLSRQFLERAGYEVTTCANGIEAWQCLQEEADRFDLLITDLTMPQMTGVELAAKAMQLRPELPVILCTGFSEQLDSKQAREMGVRAYLNKPLTSAELLACVNQTLGGE